MNSLHISRISHFELNSVFKLMFELPKNEKIIVEVTTLEPFDKKIVAELGDKFNIYHKVVLVIKCSTQEYYNMRIVLGLITFMMRVDF